MSRGEKVGRVKKKKEGKWSEERIKGKRRKER